MRVGLRGRVGELSVGRGGRERAEAALRRGLGLLKEMQQWGLTPDVISYTALLSAGTKAVRLGDAKMAAHGLDVLDMMQRQGVQADVVAYTTVLNTFCAAAARGMEGNWVQRAQQVLARMRANAVRPTGVTCRVLVSTCVAGVRALCGDSEGVETERRLDRLFRRLDRDGDGSVSAGELRNALRSLGGRPRGRRGERRVPAERFSAAAVRRFMREVRRWFGGSPRRRGGRRRRGSGKVRIAEGGVQWGGCRRTRTGTAGSRTRS